jgi:hypothetical protein
LIIILKRMNQNSLNVESVTWTRDSHGLFDYESKNVHRKTHSPTEPQKLVRTGPEVALVPSVADVEEEQSTSLIRFEAEGSQWRAVTASDE